MQGSNPKPKKTLVLVSLKPQEMGFITFEKISAGRLVRIDEIGTLSLGLAILLTEFEIGSRLRI